MFTNASYDTKKEKTKHIKEMLAEGWKIDWENKLSVGFKKSKTIE